MADNMGEKMKGVAKETMGKVTGDDDQVREGEAQQKKAQKATRPSARRPRRTARPRRLPATRASSASGRTDPGRAFARWSALAVAAGRAGRESRQLTARVTASRRGATLPGGPRRVRGSDARSPRRRPRAPDPDDLSAR
jgi:hypothetical protein